MKRLSPALLLLLLISLSCCTNGRKDYRDVVAEWTGKEILFPDSMESPDRKRIALPTADFTIVSYYDSAGCTGCRMRLAFWEDFMDMVDTVKGSKSVSLVIIGATKDAEELKQLTKHFGFSYIMVYDQEDNINTLNRFPDDPKLQTFLLDSDNKVIAIGNPLDGLGLERIYLSHIGDMRSLGKNEVEYEYDFGKLSSGEVGSHVFHMRNEDTDTLRVREILTSCECTVGRVSAKNIAPGASYNMTVSFSDTIPGDFYRSVTLLFENNKTEIRFVISGVIN